jgi:hypothetical protein
MNSDTGTLRGMWWLFGSTMVPMDDASRRTKSYQKAMGLANRVRNMDRRKGHLTETPEIFF